MKTKTLVLCGVCAAIICVLAPLAIPITGLVPVTLATFAVMLAGVLLGGRFGALSALIYLIIGAVGLPVFSGYSGGIAKLFGPTGGYLIGYIPLAFIVGALYHGFGRNASGFKKYAVMVASMIAGTAVLYAFGTAWFCIVTETDVIAALMTCVVPFLIGDALKILAVTLLCPQLEKAIAKIPDRSRENESEKSEP